MDQILKDDHYPGIMDNAINRKINFYETIFDLSFGNKNPPSSEVAPDDIPASLIETFHLKLQNEARACREHSAHTPKYKNREKNRTIKTLNREEFLLANTAEIDIENVVRNLPITEFSKASNCLQRAVKMNDFAKSFRVAAEAFENAPADLAEEAAISGVKMFENNEQTNVNSKKSFKQIEIVSYLGITKLTGEIYVEKTSN